jgi:SPP1 gp7 family putative phage head morphogenesis protein
VELAYSQDILRVVQALDAAARAAVKTRGPALLAAFRERGDAEEDDWQGSWIDLLNMLLLWIALEAASSLLNAERLIRTRAQAVADFGDRDWRAIVRRAYGVDVTRGTPGLQDVLRGFEQENLALVRSVPEQYTSRLRAAFTTAVLEGRGVRDMADDVRAATRAGRARGRFIARDQIGRLNGQLQRLRQRALGVESYVWITMLDERVRPTHLARHGNEYRWDAPGIRPGTEINCRCSAAAVLPGLTAEQIRGIG